MNAHAAVAEAKKAFEAEQSRENYARVVQAEEFLRFEQDAGAARAKRKAEEQRAADEAELASLLEDYGIPAFNKAIAAEGKAFVDVFDRCAAPIKSVEKIVGAFRAARLRMTVLHRNLGKGDFESMPPSDTAVGLDNAIGIVGRAINDHAVATGRSKERGLPAEFLTPVAIGIR